MPLPTAFSNNTNPTGPQLDGNFTAVGALTVIPCAVSGNNGLTLTPLANTPVIAAYSNYLRVSGVFSANSTTTMHAQVGGLAGLPVYLDTIAGPVLTTGGEGIANCAFTLMYDSTLQGGAGGWHLYATPLGATGGTISKLTVTGLFSAAIVDGISLNATIASLTSLNAVLGSVSTLTANALLLGTSLATVSRILSGQRTLAFSVVSANAAQDQSATLSGIQLGDCLAVGVTAVPAGAGFSAYVPAAGTVNLRCLNASTVTLGAFTVIARLTGIGGAP